MQKFLPYLLHPEIKTYRYAVPKELVVKNIAAIFKRSGKVLSEPDFNGCFTSGYSFEMSVNSGAVTSGNAQFSSVLYGKIRTTDGGETMIETTTKARLPLKLIAIVVPLIGLVYLYKGISECSLQFCLIAAAMIFLSPLVCNWLAGVSNASIQGRFERYIDRDLSKTMRLT